MLPRVFDELINEIRSFAQELDWEQFHTPKNLLVAVAGGQASRSGRAGTPHAAISTL